MNLVWPACWLATSRCDILMPVGNGSVIAWAVPPRRRTSLSAAALTVLRQEVT